MAHSGQYTNDANKVADENSVLLCVRAPVGIVNITNREIAIGRGLCAVSPLNEMLTDFIFHWLNAFQNDFIAQATGTTFIAITAEVVKQQLVPIPPIDEQTKILKSIENGYLCLNEIAENLS